MVSESDEGEIDEAPINAASEKAKWKMEMQNANIIAALLIVLHRIVILCTFVYVLCVHWRQKRLSFDEFPVS